MTRETVIGETPAFAATSRIVTPRLGLRLCRSLAMFPRDAFTRTGFDYACKRMGAAGSDDRRLASGDLVPLP
jgi:hypothetical protein